jgi:hypothetical protein
MCVKKPSHHPHRPLNKKIIIKKIKKMGWYHLPPQWRGWYLWPHEPPRHTMQPGGSGLPFPLWGWSGSTTLLSGRQCSGGGGGGGGTTSPLLYLLSFFLYLFFNFLISIFFFFFLCVFVFNFFNLWA